jgi:hypothetical protein
MKALGTTRPGAVGPNLSDLIEHHAGEGSQHLRFSKNRLHVKEGFRLSGLLEKMGEPQAIKKRTAERMAAVEHIKAAIDAEYGDGMGRAVFAHLVETDQVNVSRGVRQADLRRIRDVAEDVQLDRVLLAERRFGGSLLVPIARYTEKTPLDPQRMKLVRDEMAKAILAADDKADLTKVASEAFRVNAPSLQAFNTTHKEMMLSLRTSDTYLSAPNEGKKKELEEQLEAVLKDPAAVAIIERRGLSPESAAVSAYPLLAFRMTKEEAEKALQPLCTLVSAAANEPGAYRSMGCISATALRKTLSAMLKDPTTREAIRQAGLKPVEAVAIRFYLTQAYQEIQAVLRGKEKDGDKKPPKQVEVAVKQLADECARGLRKLPPLPEGTEFTFRGTSYFEGGSVGSLYKDPAFVSSTTKREIAEERFPGKFVLKFVAPRGFAVDVSKFTDKGTAAKEAEVLFPHNTTFQVSATELTGKKTEDGIDIRMITLTPMA